MKFRIFFFLFLISQFVFSQENRYRGTIKLKKIQEICYVNVLGYTGTNFITRNELLKAQAVELNASCNSEIISYNIGYTYFDTSNRKFCVGPTFSLMGLGEGYQGIDNLTIRNIVIKNKNTGEETELSKQKIEFKITD